MAKIDQKSIENILKSGQETFLSYLSISKINKEREEIIKSIDPTKLNEQPTEKTIYIDGAQIKVNASKDNNGNIKLQFPALAKNQPLKVKEITSYTPQEIQTLLSSKDITLELDPKGDYLASTNVKSPSNDQEYKIGGKDKIELYDLHLANLGKMLMDLQSGEKNYDSLISMTTGSGKTFTLALMMFAIGMAGEETMVTLSKEQLLGQYVSDSNRLLPQNFLQENLEEVKEGQEPTLNKKITVGTRETLLENNKNFQKIVDKFSQKNIIAFHDEAHVIKNELTLRALQKLQKFCKNIYSTATPSIELYQLGGNKLHTIASMTDKEKTEGGYAQASIKKDESTKSVSQLDKETKNSVRWNEKIARFLSQFLDIKYPNNIKVPYLDSVYQVNSKDNIKPGDLEKNETLKNLSPEEKLRHIARWNIKIPALEKTLVYASSFDDLVNIDGVEKSLEKIEGIGDKFYHNKNDFSREMVLEAVSLGKYSDSDSNTYQHYHEYKRKEFIQKTEKELKKICQDHNITLDGEIIENLANEISRSIDGDRLRRLSEANTLDFAFSVILGYQETKGLSNQLGAINDKYGKIYLNQRRFKDKGELLVDIVRNCKDISELKREDLKKLLTYNEKDNPQGLENEELVDSLTKTIRDFASNLSPLYDPQHLESLKTNENLIALIDNSPFKRGNESSRFYVPQEIKKISYILKKQYWTNPEEIKDNETIESNQPFSTFNADIKSPKLGEGKNRQKRMVEGVSPIYTETTYKPVVGSKKIGNNISLTNKDVINAFKIGIVPLMVNNKIIEGYNDPNLHNTKEIVSDPSSPMIDPNNLKQHQGRNRGLDKLEQPTNTCIVANGIKMIKNQKEYKDMMVNRTGDELRKKIFDFVKSKSKNNMSDEEVAEKIMAFVLESFDNIGKYNSYNFGAIERDFVKAMNHAIKEVEKEKGKLEKGTQLNLLSRIIAVLVYSIVSLIYKIQERHNKRKIKEQIKLLTEGKKTFEKQKQDQPNFDLDNNNSYKNIKDNLSYNNFLLSTTPLEAEVNLQQYNLFTASIGKEMAELIEIGNKIEEEKIDGTGKIKIAAAVMVAKNLQKINNIIEKIKKEDSNLSLLVKTPQYLDTLKFYLKKVGKERIEKENPDVLRYIADVEKLQKGEIKYGEFIENNFFSKEKKGNSDILEVKEKLENMQKIFSTLKQYSTEISDAHQHYANISNEKSDQNSVTNYWKAKLEGTLPEPIRSSGEEGIGFVFSMINKAKSMTEILPAINKIQSIENGVEVRQVSKIMDNLLKNVVKSKINDKEINTNPYKAEANKFNQARKEERKKGNELNYDQISEYKNGNRVTKIKEIMGMNKFTKKQQENEKKKMYIQK